MDAGGPSLSDCMLFILVFSNALAYGAVQYMAGSACAHTSHRLRFWYSACFFSWNPLQVFFAPRLDINLIGFLLNLVLACTSVEGNCLSDNLEAEADWSFVWSWSLFGLNLLILSKHHKTHHGIHQLSQITNRHPQTAGNGNYDIT